MHKLGFGFLRLPMIEQGEKKVIDIEVSKKLVDRYLELGGFYFDTAYTYLDGTSETGLRECLVERYPRDRYFLADKIPSWKPTSRENCWDYFNEMKERCGVEYFDRYMLHWLNAEHYAICEKFDGFGFLRELKEKGLAKEIGFSFHDTADVLDKILTDHPEVDCVLMQINYLDWENPAVQSRLCYETAVRHGKKIIVMEPVKGGTLATVPEKAFEIMEAAAPGRSPAEWAVRFVKSLPGVETVLSGMNAIEQVEQNIAIEAGMSEEEYKVIEQVRAILQGESAIPCTACRYCCSGCPMQINIPEYFKLYNAIQRYPSDGWKITPAYAGLKKLGGGPADCIGCKACESYCPQRLPITELLEKVKATFEK